MKRAGDLRRSRQSRRHEGLRQSQRKIGRGPVEARNRHHGWNVRLLVVVVLVERAIHVRNGLRDAVPGRTEQLANDQELKRVIHTLQCWCGAVLRLESDDVENQRH